MDVAGGGYNANGYDDAVGGGGYGKHDKEAQSYGQHAHAGSSLYGQQLHGTGPAQYQQVGIHSTLWNPLLVVSCTMPHGIPMQHHVEICAGFLSQTMPAGKWEQPLFSSCSLFSSCLAHKELVEIIVAPMIMSRMA